MLSNAHFWSTVSGVISGGIGFVFNVALLVIGLTVVQRRQKDAGMLIAGAAGVFLFIVVITPVATTLASRSSGGEDAVRTFAAINAATSLFRAVGYTLLLFGIVRLAAPPSSSDPTRFQ